jgi:glutaredoxin
MRIVYCCDANRNEKSSPTIALETSSRIACALLLLSTSIERSRHARPHARTHARTRRALQAEAGRGGRSLLRPVRAQIAMLGAMRKPSKTLVPVFALLLATCMAGSACNPLHEEKPRPPAAAKLAAAELPTVEVYVTDWCPYCQRLEAYLQEKQVPYVRYNVEKDAAAAREHDKMTGGDGGIPVTRIGSQVVQGYRPEVLAGILGIEAD